MISNFFLSLPFSSLGRLLENYRKLQKVNQGLEDKLLRIADKFEAEKISLTASVAELTSKLASAETQVVSLQAEAEQYKADCSLAIRSLQCRPASQFVSQRIESVSSISSEVLQFPTESLQRGSIFSFQLTSKSASRRTSTTENRRRRMERPLQMALGS